MVSHLNVLLRENQQLRDALRRLHDWALAQEGDCMFSGDHPIAQAAAALAPALPTMPDDYWLHVRGCDCAYCTWEREQP